MLLLVTVLLAGCDAGAGRTTSEALPPRPSPTPPVVSPSPGEVRLSLGTHCGVVQAEVDGVTWLADPPLGNGNPPGGWGNPQTPGRWRQTSERTALFLADTGVVASFVRPSAPPPPTGCA